MYAVTIKKRNRPDETLLPELINKRPFKEADHMKKNENLQENST